MASRRAAPSKNVVFVGDFSKERIKELAMGHRISSLVNKNTAAVFIKPSGRSQMSTNEAMAHELGIKVFRDNSTPTTRKSRAAGATPTRPSRAPAVQSSTTYGTRSRTTSSTATPSSSTRTLGSRTSNTSAQRHAASKELSELNVDKLNLRRKARKAFQAMLNSPDANNWSQATRFRLLDQFGAYPPGSAFYRQAVPDKLSIADLKAFTSLSEKLAQAKKYHKQEKKFRTEKDRIAFHEWAAEVSPADLDWLTEHGRKFTVYPFAPLTVN
jgi:hypothetical protein